MNPALSVDIDQVKKTLTATGTIAVGEKVDVSVSGMPSMGEMRPRFRIVDEFGNDLARYPMSDTDTVTIASSTWTFTVNLDTDRMRARFRGVGFRDRLALGIIVDSADDFAQYARGTVKVCQWTVSGEDDPTTLPDWRATLGKLNASISSLDTKLESADTKFGQIDAKATVAGNSATAASASAGAAATSAAQANEYANGKTVNGVETKGAKQYAADAKASADAAAGSATGLEQAKTAAEAARDKANEYANGKIVGGVVTEDGAKQYAEQAETVLASAVKTTEQALTDDQKAQARTNIGAATASALTAEVNRASAAESANATSISDEATRAQNAESALSSGKQDSLSQDQLAAANSGVTATKVSQYDAHVGNSGIHVSASDKSAWDGHKNNGDIHVTADQKAAWTNKQATLVSGTNIKTVNGQSIVGSGNLTISGGTTDYNALTNKPKIGGVTLSGNKTLSELGAMGVEQAYTKAESDENYATLSHALSHATGGEDAITPASIGAAAASHTHASVTDGTCSISADRTFVGVPAWTNATFNAVFSRRSDGEWRATYNGTELYLQQDGGTVRFGTIRNGSHLEYAAEDGDLDGEDDVSFGDTYGTLVRNVPTGTLAVVGHTHTKSQITDFGGPYLQLAKDDIGGTSAVVIGSDVGASFPESGPPTEPQRGVSSLANGFQIHANGPYSHAEGKWTFAIGEGSHSEGYSCFASGEYSHAEGSKASTREEDTYSYTYNGNEDGEYESHGEGTFNINPLPQGAGETDPASGFFVGETSLKQRLGEKANTDQLQYSSTSTPADRTCATVTVASTGASVTVPKPSTANKITAFCVYLDMTTLTGDAPTVGFKYSDNTDADILTRGGEGLSYETGAVNAVFFIQCGTKYIASAQVYK